MINTSRELAELYLNFMDSLQSIQTLIQKEGGIVHHHVDELYEILAIIGLRDDCHLMNWRFPHRLHYDGDVIPWENITDRN